jgi:hypothetical protein
MWQLLAGLLAGGAAGVLGRSVLDRTTVRLQEYKIFIEDTSRYSDRRQTVSNIYVAVNTILLSATAWLLGNSHSSPSMNADDPRVLFILVFLSAAGVAASSMWLFLVHRYERIIAARVRELKKIEKELAASHKMYQKMDDAFCGKVPSFSGPERVLPVVFIVLDSLLFCLALVASTLRLAAVCGCR